MIFARGNTGKPRGAKDVELYISRYRDGGWSEPELMEISDADSWDSCPAFSKDGNTLYFASNRPLQKDSAVKDFDIWKTERSIDSQIRC